MSKPWIVNVSKDAVKRGQHPVSDKTLLIQIVDTMTEFPEPALKDQFSAIYQFRFLDIEADEKIVSLDFGIQQDQADEIYRILQVALANDINVVVHCHAGICRSGAVVEMGVMMGFRELNVYRQPNTLVKQKLMKAAKWTYDS